MTNPRKSRYDRVNEAAAKIDPATLLADVAAAATAAPLTDHEVALQAAVNRQRYGIGEQTPPYADAPASRPDDDNDDSEPVDAVALLEAEVGSYESNIQELNDVRKLKQSLTTRISKVKSPERSELDAFRLEHQMLTEREHSAREAIKLFNKGRLSKDLNLPTVRIEIVDFTGDEADNVEGDL